jgi:hypothetical protein
VWCRRQAHLTLYDEREPFTKTEHFTTPVPDFTPVYLRAYEGSDASERDRCLPLHTIT